MTSTLELFGIGNPNPSSALCLKNRASSMALCATPSSLRFGSILRPHITCKFSTARGLGLGFLPLPRSSLGNRSIFSFAASHEESNPSDVEVHGDKIDPKVEAEESEEAWKQTLASFKEQALKMQSISQEAYEEYSKKAVVILKDTSERLKIQAEKAREDLIVIAKELSEESKVYLNTAAKNSPELVNDIVETFSTSTDDLKEVSKLRDFYIGIPYGGLLFMGGFLTFMLTGSISAIRFGVILGGALLALSVSSLRAWRKGVSSPLAVKGQAAIATVLFLREIRLLFARPVFTSYIAVLVSGAATAFYVYRIAFYNGHIKGPNFEPGTEN